MKLALSCLGFAIYTSAKSDSWDLIKNLESASKFSKLLIKDLRPLIAKNIFYEALERRDRLRR